MSDFDPTTNRVHFGLLTNDEQAALQAWPYGWAIYWAGSFDAITDDPAWMDDTIYRGLPKPVVIKRWAAIYPRASTGSWRDTIHDVTKVSGADMIGIIQLEITDGVPSVKILEVKK